MGDRTIPASHIAAIANTNDSDLQTLLSEATAQWHAANARVVGVLAENGNLEGQCSAAYLRDIATCRRYSIQLDAAPIGTGCHLDPDAIHRACAELLPQIAGLA